MSATGIPNPWVPIDQLAHAAYIWGTVSGFISSNWPAANRAFYVPVVFPCDATIYSLSVLGTSTTGNYDIGFYGPNMAKITSKGSTAMASALLTHTFSDVRVKAGPTYWAALALSSTGAIEWCSFTSALRASTIEVAQESSAFPLPATMTPAAMAHDRIPIFSFGVR